MKPFALKFMFMLIVVITFSISQSRKVILYKEREHSSSPNSSTTYFIPIQEETNLIFDDCFIFGDNDNFIVNEEESNIEILDIESDNRCSFILKPKEKGKAKLVFDKISGEPISLKQIKKAKTFYFIFDR